MLSRYLLGLSGFLRPTKIGAAVGALPIGTVMPSMMHYMARHLPRRRRIETATGAMRQTFPFFNLFVIVTAAPSSALRGWHDQFATALMGMVVITTILARQILIPAINRIVDCGHRQRFRWLQGLSVVITPMDIAAAGVAWVRLA